MIYTYPDPEVGVKDIVKAAMTDLGETVTVSVGGPPTGWIAGTEGHIEVTCDGTPRTDHPIAVHATIRLVAHARSTSEAKRLANLAHGAACAHDGTGDVTKIRSLTGMLPARDPETGNELAMTTVQVTVRSIEAVVVSP